MMVGLSLNFLKAMLKRVERGREVPSSCTLDLHNRNGRAYNVQST